MHALVITALLIVTPPGAEPENLAAFFTSDGPVLCDALAEALNREHPPELYVCQTEGVENAATNATYRGKGSVGSAWRL